MKNLAEPLNGPHTHRGASPFADAFSQYDTERPSSFTRLLWWMAGADERLLALATHSDHVKFQCMGGIVLSTGVMAAFAGGYGFYTIFQPKTYALNEGTHWPTSIMAIAFGMLWGLIILNIDRFIVAGSGKGDGTEAITRKEFLSALPRILMGAIIALTVSKPIEIRMFKTEIDQELNRKQRQIADNYREGVKKKFAPRIDLVNKKIVSMQEEITSAHSSYLKLQDLYNMEMGGKVSGHAGEGPIARQYKTQMDQALLNEQALTQRLSPELSAATQERERLQKQQLIEENDSEATAKSLDGLLERIKLAHEIAGWPISLFITLLFMALELTPIFFKLMLIRSPYDYLEEGLKEYTKVKYGMLPVGKYINRLNGQEELKYRHYDSFVKEIEQVKSLKAQRELMEYIAQQWAERMKHEVKAHPERFETRIPATSPDDSTETKA